MQRVGRLIILAEISSRKFSMGGSYEYRWPLVAARGRLIILAEIS
jgi:hypothetical protein